MRLSEAIRLGSMLRPQAFGYFYSSGKSCAWGAAFEAMGLLDTSRSGNDCISKAALVSVRPLWRSISKVATDCPACGADWPVPRSHSRDAQGAIVHLNNDHRWTREQIADFIESLE